MISTGAIFFEKIVLEPSKASVHYMKPCRSSIRNPLVTLEILPEALVAYGEIEPKS